MSEHPSWLCRVYWDSGTAVMLTSAMIMSCGALAVALINDRVPVFEIVVRHPFKSFPVVLLLHMSSLLRACSCPRLWPGQSGRKGELLSYQCLRQLFKNRPQPFNNP